MPTVRAQPPGDVTVLLKRFNDGDSEAGDQLIELVSYELRRLAGSYLRNERRGHSIQPTELVNEAVLRLMGLDRIDWQHRSHFFRVAARKMSTSWRVSATYCGYRRESVSISSSERFSRHNARRSCSSCSGDVAEVSQSTTLATCLQNGHWRNGCPQPHSQFLVRPRPQT